MLWTWCTPPPCCPWLPSPQTWMRFIGFLFFLSFFSPISFSPQLIFSLEPYCIKLKRPVIFQRKKKCRGRSVARFLKYAFAPGNQNKRSTIFIPVGCDHDHKCSALKTVSCLKTVCWASFQIFFFYSKHAHKKSPLPQMPVCVLKYETPQSCIIGLVPRQSAT